LSLTSRRLLFARVVRDHIRCDSKRSHCLKLEYAGGMEPKASFRRLTSDVGGSKRIATDLEEVVLNSDRAYPDDAPPDLC
jgi:hypothetical protein